MPTVKDILKHVRKLLARRGGWCQRTAARDKDGKRMDNSTEPGAVSFCASGAIEHAVCKLGGGQRLSRRAHRAVYDAIGAARKRQTQLDVITIYNDHGKRRKRDVLRVIDRAIRSCRRSTRDTS